MLTTNYERFHRYKFSAGESGRLELKNKAGESKYTYSWSSSDTNHSFLYAMRRQFNDGASLSAQYGIAFGSGTTAPTKNDYTLESQINTVDVNITPPSSITTIETDDYYEYQAAYTVVATTSITISEVGIYISTDTYSSMSGGGTGRYPILIDRTLLESPISLTANETAEVTYKLRFYY